ncbi:hypothetical protein AJ88_24045 [Mesorhizobium amorphae CCBAU 01583]|nr:hypothetical protein AJ88_24045 [Mesorhizobium amorphae CCBAU 01583]
MKSRVVLDSTPLRKKYHAGLADHVAGKVFNSRMVARGIDQVPEGETIAPEPKLYLEHVPTIDVSKGPARASFAGGRIVGWGLVMVLGLRLAGLG